MADYSDLWYSPAQQAADDQAAERAAHQGQVLVLGPAGERWVSARNLKPGDRVTDAPTVDEARAQARKDRAARRTNSTQERST